MSFLQLDHLGLYQHDPELEARADKVARFLELESAVGKFLELRPSVKADCIGFIGAVMGDYPIPTDSQFDAMMGMVPMSNPQRGKTPDQSKPVFPSKAMRGPLDWRPR